MRLKFQDSERNITDLYVNPEFTIETVKLMLCQKAKNLTFDSLVLIISRSEVSFDLAEELFSDPTLSPYLNYLPLHDERRIKEYKKMELITITALEVCSTKINVECKFEDDTRSVRVTVDCLDPVFRLVKKIQDELHHIHKYKIELYFCGKHMDTGNKPIYKYGILDDVIIEGKFQDGTIQMTQISCHIRDVKSQRYTLLTPTRIRLNELKERIKQATGYKKDFALVSDGKFYSNPSMIIYIKPSMVFKLLI